ncbi:MAG: hypothetical protein WCF18_01615 [Chthoniobacteraceae bacterium]
MFDPDAEDREERRQRRLACEEDREPEDYEPRSAREEDFAAAEYFTHLDRIHDR